MRLFIRLLVVFFLFELILYRIAGISHAYHPLVYFPIIPAICIGMMIGGRSFRRGHILYGRANDHCFGIRGRRLGPRAPLPKGVEQAGTLEREIAYGRIAGEKSPYHSLTPILANKKCWPPMLNEECPACYRHHQRSKPQSLQGSLPNRTVYLLPVRWCRWF